MTSRRQQRDNRPDPLDVAALEHELHDKQKPNRSDRRTAARAEAESISRVTPKHLRTRPGAS